MLRENQGGCSAVTEYLAHPAVTDEGACVPWIVVHFKLRILRRSLLRPG